MEQLQALWQQFGAAHPVYSHGLTLLVGTFLGPRLVSWLEKTGIPRFIDWFDSHQETLLARAGLTPAQIRQVRQHEVDDMRAAAARLEARLEAEEHAEALPPGAPPPAGAP